MNSVFKPVALQDTEPAIMDQCASKDWRAGVFKSTDGVGVYRFNPGVCVTDDKVWLVERRTRMIDQRSDLVVSWLNSDMEREHEKIIGDGKRNLEDPRAIQTEDGYQIWVCHYEPRLRRIPLPAIGIMSLNEQWWVEKFEQPKFANNGRSPQKNWCPFDGGNKYVYHVGENTGHTVIDNKDNQMWVGHGITNDMWPYGEARCGTPPVLVDDEYVSFFHSCVFWKNDPHAGPRMRYFMGAYAFTKEPPYTITRYTKEPLLTGSGKGPALKISPAVVFPCGQADFGDDWLVTFGINDCASAWAMIPKEDVNRAMTRC